MGRASQDGSAADGQRFMSTFFSRSLLISCGTECILTWPALAQTTPCKRLGVRVDELSVTLHSGYDRLVGPTVTTACCTTARREKMKAPQQHEGTTTGGGAEILE